MSCRGVYIDARAMRCVFNYELALRQGLSLATRHDFDGDPEYVRGRVQEELRRTHPLITVAFWDSDSELEIECPKVGGEYSLMIQQEAPIYSACMH